MNASLRQFIHPIGRFAVAASLLFMCGAALGDDLNPPPYRGAPLSVFAHWNADASGALMLNQFSWVDDNDPLTTLTQFQPIVSFDPTLSVYDFRIPNFIDQLPIKFLRIQLTWAGTSQPPISLSSDGFDGVSVAPGVLTFASGPLVFTPGPGGYQYFDFEYQPNPDFETIHVQLPPDGLLVQVVIDSISIPAPTSFAVLALGGLAVIRRRRSA